MPSCFMPRANADDRAREFLRSLTSPNPAKDAFMIEMYVVSLCHPTKLTIKHFIDRNAWLHNHRASHHLADDRRASDQVPLNRPSTDAGSLKRHQSLAVPGPSRSPPSEKRRIVKKPYLNSSLGNSCAEPSALSRAYSATVAVGTCERQFPSYTELAFAHALDSPRAIDKMPVA